MHDRQSQFARLVRGAVECRACFTQGEVSSPFIDVAQPRSVGPKYWTSGLRVAVLMLNPGQSRNDAGARGYLQNIHLFRKGALSLEKILEGQRSVMAGWGRPAGRFGSFYLEGLGLRLAETAFVNVAWCATDKNQYPATMLRRCFELHTGPLLKLLAPHVVVASGSRVHDFANQVRSLVPGSLVIETLHYAHRAGTAKEGAELVRVKAALRKFRQTVSTG